MNDYAKSQLEEAVGKIYAISLIMRQEGDAYLADFLWKQASKLEKLLPKEES